MLAAALGPVIDGREAMPFKYRNFTVSDALKIDVETSYVMAKGR